MDEIAVTLAAVGAAATRDEVTLTDFDPDGEVKIVAAALYAGLRRFPTISCSRSRGG